MGCKAGKRLQPSTSRDHDNVKRHWIEKCCFKFKKPTGNPGDPKRDMILRCYQIQQQIHAKLALVIMGIDSEGDQGLSIDSNASDEDSDDDNNVEGEVAAALGGLLGADVAVGGSRAGSRTTTLTVGQSGGVDGGLDVFWLKRLVSL
jgi:hypothetical protein